MKRPQRFIIELRPEPPGRDEFGRDPWYRLRGLLKRLLRTHGFRCVKIETDPGQSAAAEPGTDNELSLPGAAGCSGLNDRTPADLFTQADQGKETTDHTADRAPYGGPVSSFETSQAGGHRCGGVRRI